MSCPIDPNANQLAAPRDASWYASIGRAYVRHIVGPGCMSACGRSMLIIEDAEPAADVPLTSRCQRSGCKQRWP